MGVSTCSFLNTNFEEFFSTLEPLIDLGRAKYPHDEISRALVFFDIRDNILRHDIIHDTLINVEEYASTAHIGKEAYEKYAEGVKDRDYTVMDSIMLNDLGIPDGLRGLRTGLGANSKAIEFTRALCYLFGGYFQEKDSNDQEFIYINKDLTKFVQWIFEQL